ncbi:MAG: hypothetical protein V4439_00405 [Patescibacteria group bacterium]
MPKTRNIIIFAVIAVAITFIYILFFKPSAPATPALTSSFQNTKVTTTSAGTAANPAIGGDFLSLLLSVKSIKLDDSIFTDPAFLSLHDSSIEIVSDGSQGRSNPFAPLGADVLSPQPTTVNSPSTTSTTVNSLLNIPNTTNTAPAPATVSPSTAPASNNTTPAPKTP